MTHLEFLRRQKGLSQARLAELMGVDQSLVSRVERGWLARPPAGFEAGAKKLFGQEWTFQKLVEPMPDLHGTGDAV